jgi:hypothetical protein
MAEFDEKLNSLLSNPDAMAQIMQMAQALGGAQDSAQQAKNTPENKDSDLFSNREFSEPPVSPQYDPITSLFGDPTLLMKLMPLVQELSGHRDSNARALLYALRPYLKTERQEKIERALQFARLFCVGKKLLSEREG